MGKNITLYIDDETEKLLGESKNVNYSKLFQKSLKHYLLRAKELNKELEDLPSADEFEEQFKFLPSVHEVEMLKDAMDELPSEDVLKDCFSSLPSIEEVEKINEELDKTIEKLEEIKELKWKHPNLR